MSPLSEQLELCRTYNVDFTETPENSVVGISANVGTGVYPINGLRHPVVGNTSGWYIWAGEYSSDPSFFVPIHAMHLSERCPQITKYLGLPEGWRFQYAPGYEDVWEVKSLLEISIP